VKIAGLDLRRFEFDYDLTWFAFLLNADETIYGRYGGRDASDAEARLSMKGLRRALDRALEAHKNSPPAQELAGKQQRAEDFASAQKHRGCIHCHNVNEFARADSRAAGVWDRASAWVYPLPENVGITLDVDAGDLVKSVAPRSAAENAGLKPGDRLATLNGHGVASFADASFSLHKAPAKGEIRVSWLRAGKEMSGTLALTDGWRKTDLSWRPSMRDLLPSAPLSGDELTAAEKKALGLDPKRAALRQNAEVHTGLKAAGLADEDVVIGFDGNAVEGEIGKLHSYVRRNYLIGDEVTINVIRAGKRVDFQLKLK
jgi:predicted metalloprotease with PDZ domain